MKLLLLIFSVYFSAAASFRYDGYNAIKAGPLRTEGQVKLLNALVDEDTRTRKILVLQDHLFVKSYADIIVSPDRVSMVMTALKQAGIDYEIQEQDVQRSLDETMAKNKMIKEDFLKSGKKGPPDYYMENDEMEGYVANLASDNGIEILQFGPSFEGRNIYAAVINGDRSDLPGIWLDAGIHCREWISQATAVHILETILTSSSAEAVDLRTNYRVYVAPNLNPDGYEYTWYFDRYWRKNRSNEGGCGGVDLNRNFDVNYDFCGTSDNPCSDTYSGPSAASEVETQAIVDVVKNIQSNFGGIELFVSMHAYAQFWLIPWGGTPIKPDDYDDLLAAAEVAVDAIAAVNGLEFVLGTVPDLLYCAAGGSFDWAKNNGNLPGDGAGIKYTYTPELRPDYNCCGLPGFNPDPSNIEPSGEEVFAGFYALVKEVA